MVYNIHILQTRKTGRVVAAAAASVLCCMGAVFPATIGVTAASADEPVELVVNGGFEDDLKVGSLERCGIAPHRPLPSLRMMCMVAVAP